MITGIGNDIIEITRIRTAIQRHGANFIDRLFTPKEKEYCLKFKEPERHFSGRFAAKEAFVKALGTGFTHEVSWLDIEILNDAKGKPEIHLLPSLIKRLEPQTFFLSISHCREYATAVVICENNTKSF